MRHRVRAILKLRNRVPHFTTLQDCTGFLNSPRCSCTCRSAVTPWLSCGVGCTTLPLPEIHASAFFFLSFFHFSLHSAILQAVIRHQQVRC